METEPGPESPRPDESFCQHDVEGTRTPMREGNLRNEGLDLSLKWATMDNKFILPDFSR